MKWADWFLGQEVWFARAIKNNSQELATLLYKLQESHADMASRMEYLENLLADREMQEGDIELESAEEEREEKKGNGI